MVIAVPTVDLTAENKQTDFVQKLLPASGTLTKVTSMGKRQLAYAIKRQTEGTYLVAEVTGNVKAPEIEKKAKSLDDVLRFMLILKEE
jgi:ribosomal protein S6